MTEPQQTHKPSKNQWILFISFLLAVYLAPIILAQDEVPTDDSTSVSVEIIAEETTALTEIPLLPTQTHMPTIPPTRVPQEPTLFPTIPSMTPIPSMPTQAHTATMTATLMPTQAHTATTTATLIAVESILLPRMSPTVPGSLVPTQTHTPTTIASLIATQIHTPTMTATLIITQTHTPTITATLLPLEPTSFPSMSPTASVLLVPMQDLTGTTIPLEPTIEDHQDETPEPQTMSIVHLSGRIISLLPLEQATVTINTSLQETTAIANDGTFEFRIPPGSYQLTARALRHLPLVIEVAISDQQLILPTIMLKGGDVDGNTIIDLGDVNLIVQNYGLTVPPAPPSLDLNNDTVINLLDLTIVNANREDISK